MTTSRKFTPKVWPAGHDPGMPGGKSRCTCPECEKRRTLDPRWGWAEVTALGDPGPVYVKTYCKHLETVDVTVALTGDVAARLCLTCDTKFYMPWVTDPHAGALPGARRLAMAPVLASRPGNPRHRRPALQPAEARCRAVRPARPLPGAEDG